MDVNGSVSLLEKEISKIFSGKQPKELYQPMQYMLELNPQRRFPQLTLWGCYLYSGAIQPALMPAAGVEVFYSFFLIHDDMLEHKSSRNHRQSVHSKWNNNIAILSGDAMIFKALELLIQVDPPLIKPVITLFNKCFTEICELKQQELNNPPEVTDLPGPCYGILAGFSMRLGAMIAGASNEELQVIDHAVRSFPAASDQIQQGIQSLSCDHKRKDQFLAWIAQSSVGS